MVTLDNIHPCRHVGGLDRPATLDHTLLMLASLRGCGMVSLYCPVRVALVLLPLDAGPISGNAWSHHGVPRPHGFPYPDFRDHSRQHEESSFNSANRWERRTANGLPARNPIAQ